tara:strand:- start:2504 stop:3142 length:639 start_codon:yes stop_codon:yes gene_type:complete
MSDLRVPVIDVAPFLAGDADATRTIAHQVDEACREIGFLTIIGHGIPEAQIDAARRAGRDFFKLPLEQKQHTPRPSHESGRGYTVFGDQALAYSLGVETPPDLQESFGIGSLDVLPDDPYYHAPEAWTFFTPNIWPESPAESRPALSGYFARVDLLTRDLMRLFALALIQTTVPSPSYRRTTNPVACRSKRGVARGSTSCRRPEPLSSTWVT